MPPSSAFRPKAPAKGTLGVAGGRSGHRHRVLHRFKELGRRDGNGAKWICGQTAAQPIFSLSPGKIADFKRCKKCFEVGAMDPPGMSRDEICALPGCTDLAYGEFLMKLAFCREHLRAIRRQATRAAKRKKVTDSERLQLGEAYGWACAYCGRRGTPERDPDGRFWHLDHVEAWCETWDNSPQALVLACTRDNTKKRDQYWRPGSEPIESIAGEQMTLPFLG